MTTPLLYPPTTSSTVLAFSVNIMLRYLQNIIFQSLFQLAFLISYHILFSPSLYIALCLFIWSSLHSVWLSLSFSPPSVSLGHCFSVTPLPHSCFLAHILLIFVQQQEGTAKEKDRNIMLALYREITTGILKPEYQRPKDEVILHIIHTFVCVCFWVCIVSICMYLRLQIRWSRCRFCSVCVAILSCIAMPHSVHTL